MENERDLVDQIIGEGRRGAPPVDSEFLADFLAETREHLERIELNVLELERAPENQENIHGLFRSFHTIKGLAGFVGQSVVARVAHRTETVLDDCRKKMLTPGRSVASAILQSADLIQRLCTQISLGQDGAFLEEVNSHVDRLDRRDFGPEAPDRAAGNASVVEGGHELRGAVAPEISAVPGPEDQGPPEPESWSSFSQKIFREELPEARQALRDQGTSREEPAAFSEIFGAGTPELSRSEVPEGKSWLFGGEPSAGGEQIRISAARVGGLVDLLGELLIAQSQVEQEAVQRFGPNDPLVNHLERLSRITKEVQGISMSLGMVSLKSTFQKLRRLGRDTAATLGKEVELQFFGEDTEIDRGVAEKLLDPLVHLLKNAISHGVEGRELRLARGKTPGGTVSVSARRCRGSVFLEVRDDGAGIDGDRVLRKAVDRGLVEPGTTLTEEALVELLFLPGFSTATAVDGISGRGVGMDVVKTEVSRLGGRVEVQNTPGRGCGFVLRIPINMAILNGTVVDIGGTPYVVPTLAVKRILQVTEDLWVVARGRRVMVRVRNQLVPLLPVEEMLGHLSASEENPDQVLALVLEEDQRVRALPVRSVLGRQDVVVKPLNEAFRHLEFFSGASILGDGRVAFILDVEALFRDGGDAGCQVGPGLS